MIFRNRKKHTVYTFEAPVLRSIALPITEVTSEIRAFAKEMLSLMEIFNGIGLAAPQAGKSLRMVVIDVPMDSMGTTPTPGEVLLLPRMPLVIINPTIISSSSEVSKKDEGCLSVPDIFAPVSRPEKVVFQGSTLDGEVFNIECGGLLGRCIQHEVDHLDGKLFIDRLSSEDRKDVLGEINRGNKYYSKRNYERIKVK